MPKGWTNEKYLVVIDYQRYWLNEEEMKQAKYIQSRYRDGWKHEFLKRISRGSLF